MEVRCVSTYRGCWTSRFSRHLNNWVMKFLEQICLRLQGLRVYREVDTLAWAREEDRKFYTKSLCKELALKRQVDFQWM